MRGVFLALVVTLSDIVVGVVIGGGCVFLLVGVWIAGARCTPAAYRGSPGALPAAGSLVRGRFPCTSSPVVLLHSCSRRFRSPPCVRSLFSPLFRGGWILGARCAPGDSRSRAAASRGTLRRAFSPRGRSMCSPLSRGGWIASAVASRGTPRRSPVALCLVLLDCFRALDVLPVRCWFFLVRALTALSLYPARCFRRSLVTRRATGSFPWWVDCGRCCFYLLWVVARVGSLWCCWITPGAFSLPVAGGLRACGVFPRASRSCGTLPALCCFFPARSLRRYSPCECSHSPGAGILLRALPAPTLPACCCSRFPVCGAPRSRDFPLPCCFPRGYFLLSTPRSTPGAASLWRALLRALFFPTRLTLPALSGTCFLCGRFCSWVVGTGLLPACASPWFPAGLSCVSPRWLDIGALFVTGRLRALLVSPCRWITSPGVVAGL